MKYILKDDKYSHVKSKECYGKRGEKVTLISEHGNIFIVKGSSGSFSINKDQLIKI